MNPVNNAVEDFFDDFTQTVITQKAQEVFNPLKKKFNDGGSAFDEAMMSAISTLQMGIQMVATQYIMNTLLPNIVKRGLALYSYITYGQIKRVAFSGLKKKLMSMKKGRVIFRGMSMLSDGVSDRALKAQAAMDLVNHVDNQRLQKMKIANDSRRSMESTYVGANSSTAQKSLALYTEKTKTGTWQNTKQDRKIYERATGSKLPAGLSWSKVYKELNKFSEFARSSEDEIINKAQVEFDYMAANGIVRVNS